MSDVVTAWQSGIAHTLTGSDWAGVCSTFLGAGFRVDLPGGSRRPEAVEHEVERVRRVSDLLGTHFSESDWISAARSHPELDIEVVGGWPRTYAGASTLWVAACLVGEESAPREAVLLPSPRYPGPTSGLPMYSRMRDEVALTAVEADCGIWADPDGRIIASTAGPLVVERADGTWATGTESSGWLATCVSLERSATPDLHVDDLATARYVGLIRRARTVQPLDLVS